MGTMGPWPLLLRVSFFHRAVIPPPKVESIVLQRNQLETAALSVAAMRGASWSAIRLLLRPKSGIEIVSLFASDCLTQEELHQPGMPPEGVPVPVPPPAAPHFARRGPVNIVTNQFSFNDLSTRCRSLGLGVLIGWRRDEDDPNSDAPKSYKIGVAYDATELNPLNKDEKLLSGGASVLALCRRCPDSRAAPPLGLLRSWAAMPPPALHPPSPPNFAPCAASHIQVVPKQSTHCDEA